MYSERHTSAVSGDFNACRHQNGDEFKNRQQMLNQNLQTLEQWNTAKEQVEQNVTKFQIAISQLQSQRLPNRMPQAPQQLSQYTDQMDQLKESLLCINNNLSILSQRVLNELTEYTRMCENLIINWTKDELILWKQQQKIAQYGGPDTLPNLANLTQRYQTMTDYVFTAWKYAQRSAPMLEKLTNVQQVKQVHAKLFSLFYQLLNTSFLVVHQPPMIAKNRITVRIGLLGAIDKFGFESQRTIAECRVIDEVTAAELKENPENINKPITTVGKMDDEKIKEKDIERLTKENVLGFEFKNIKVKVDSRKSSAKDGEAIKKKYYLLFSCTINIVDQPFKIFTLSLPFMVSVHGSQDKDLWAKAFWDMAYSDGKCDIPMKGRSEVSWSELAFGLKNVFSCIINANTEKKFDPQIPPERKLKDSDLAYIKFRLFNGQLPPEPNPTISRARFIDDPLFHMSHRDMKLDFSLWEWFFKIADMLQEKAGHEIRAKALWNLHLLEGFISKSEADAKLKSCKVPTLLIRFSDNNLSSVSAVVRKEDGEVDHLAPFKNKDDITDRMSLPTLIIRCEELENIDFIYPNRAKKLIEDQIPQPKQTPIKSPIRDGYTSCTIKMVNQGDVTKARKSSSGSAPNTPINNYIGSPTTASVYSPVPAGSPSYDNQKFHAPKVLKKQKMYQTNFNNNTTFDNNNFNQGTEIASNVQFDEPSFMGNNFNETIQTPNLLTQFTDMNGDTNMLDSEMIEVIYESLEKQESFFDNNYLLFNSGPYDF